MMILVSNIGSTSFKFRLFAVGDGGERELAAGGVDRIGGQGGAFSFAPAGGSKSTRACPCPNHGAAITACLDVLVEAGVLDSPQSLGAIAFKAVMAGDCDPIMRVDDKLLAAMEYFVPVAPAHNPAYIAAMRSFRQALPGVPLVAAFEPGFHRTIPARRRTYALPDGWEEKFGIRRYGYHGASHRYISQRVVELMGQPARRIISCHLGGSSSICAVRDGASVANSFGFSPQSGLPQTQRVGEFDCFGLAIVQRETGMGLEKMLDALGNKAGLAALSGTSGDMRDIRAAAAKGSARAQLALDAFVTAVRDYIGAYLVELGGADAIAFTGGIGENNPSLRDDICRGLEFAGVALDETKNASAAGECRIDREGSKTALWVMPTNEELVVARQAVELLKRKS